MLVAMSSAVRTVVVRLLQSVLFEPPQMPGVNRDFQMSDWVSSCAQTRVLRNTAVRKVAIVAIFRFAELTEVRDGVSTSKVQRLY